MQLTPALGNLDRSVRAGRCGAAGSVCVGRVDEVGLSDEALRSHLKTLGRAECRLAAMKARVLAELSRRHSKGDAQRMVRSELRSSRRDAKRDVETAAQLVELPVTSDALESGEVPVGHARLIARASGESAIDEGLLVEAAGSEPFDEFAQTVKRHQQDVADDDGQALLDRQRNKRKARVFESADSGMFVLTGEFDQITGARIATALTAKERQLWHREDPDKRATPQQRMADALAELICQPAGDGKSAGTDLLVIADFDVLKQQLDNPRLADGSPIPIVELHRLALEANLLPSIFDTKAQDMWLGRRLRTATEAQRIALIARDQHCIGCGANPLWCRAHHIVWWSKNGASDLDNFALVCDDCHHKIHDHGWQVHQDPNTGKYQLKPPDPTGKPNTARQTRPAQLDRPTQKRPTESQSASQNRRAQRRLDGEVEKQVEGFGRRAPTESSSRRSNSDRSGENRRAQRRLGGEVEKQVEGFGRRAPTESASRRSNSDRSGENRRAQRRLGGEVEKQVEGFGRRAPTESSSRPGGSDPRATLNNPQTQAMPNPPQTPTKTRQQ